VCIICPCEPHGEFLQTPGSHLQGRGCPKCSGNKKRNTAEFIEKANKVHGNKYDYSNVDYINDNTKVFIICPCESHGEFQQRPADHLQGNGCPKCGEIQSSIKRRSNTDEFIEKAKKVHGDKYDYSKVDYINMHTKVCIICESHGEFQQTPGSHLQGRGCPLCVNKTEAKLYGQLVKKYPTLLKQYKPEWSVNTLKKTNRKLPFDFCIPEYKIIIELDGLQHFMQVANWNSPAETFEMDKFKEERAIEHNHTVIRLLQDDVFNDKFDWLVELCDAIEEIKANPDITHIYICKNNEYDCY
jgi:very-short-patch-repair endonuclease